MGKLTYLRASYWAVEEITLATEGMAYSASGAVGVSGRPRVQRAPAATQQVTIRFTNTMKMLYVNTSPSTPKGTVINRS